MNYTIKSSSTWAEMDAQPRTSAKLLKKCSIPTGPGVYAWYRSNQRVYVGKAASLRNRVWNNHMGKGVCMTGSAFRRNVAEHLTIATAADIKAGRRTFTTNEVAPIREWIEGCEVAWMICDSEVAALALEAKLKREFCPPLTKL